MVDDLESLSPSPYRFTITNEDRAVGAHFSGEVLRRFGSSFAFGSSDVSSGLEISGVDCEFTGTAGQSFGAFLISGANFLLTGEANDYVGKGLCGEALPLPDKEELQSAEMFWWEIRCSMAQRRVSYLWRGERESALRCATAAHSQ